MNQYIPKRFVVKIGTSNRVVIDKEIVEVWNMQEGETWMLEVVQRVLPPAKEDVKDE